MINNLMVMNNKEQWTIGSREVAEMMEVQHKDLLKKIDSINEDFGSEEIRHEKYWVESSFENRGKQYREFLVTKRGCEFLAHKTTGTKGNLFTDRYMDRFEEMENQLSNQVVKQDSYVIADPIERAKRWIEEEETRILAEKKVAELQEVVEVQAPKVQKYNTFLEADGTMSVESFAKAFSVKDGNKKMGRNSMFKLLREMKVLTKSNAPTQAYLNRDFFKSICKTLNNGQMVSVTRVTPYGADKLMDKINKYLAEKARVQAKAKANIK